MKKRIMLYFGSFNPIHNGHTSVGRFVLENGLCDELWFVVSPQNPLKSSDLMPAPQRLEMVNMAIGQCLGGLNAVASDVEFSLPIPSYTIDTVDYLVDSNPECEFSILAGTDIMENIDRWKEYQRLLGMCRFYIYPREGYQIPQRYAKAVTILEGAPRWDFSSTEIREKLSRGEDISSMVCDSVDKYLHKNSVVGDLIERLSRQIEAGGAGSDIWLQRGKEYYRRGNRHQALNDFLESVRLDADNREAIEYIRLINEINDFRYLDYYNP